MLAILSVMTIKCDGIVLGLIDNYLSHGSIESYLRDKLVLSGIPANPFQSNGKQGEFRVAYVMSGNERSLKNRILAAENLFHAGLVNRFITLKRDGITAYDNELGRNLLNDEWTTLELQNTGINKDSIEVVPFKLNCFGTLSEIRGLLELCKLRKYRNIVIVSSDYHAARIDVTAKALGFDQYTSYEIYVSSENTSVLGLFREYLKYLAYRDVIVPFYSPS